MKQEIINNLYKKAIKLRNEHREFRLGQALEITVSIYLDDYGTESEKMTYHSNIYRTDRDPFYFDDRIDSFLEGLKTLVY